MTIVTTLPPLRVHFGTITPQMPGGIYVTESVFQDACAATGEVEVNTMPFGRRHRRETRLARTVRRMGDLAAYAWRIMTRRPDVVHINTSLDRRALVRDVGYALISRWLGQPLFIKIHGCDDTVLRTPSRFWRWMTRTTIRNADTVGILSTQVKRLFIEAGFPEEKFVVVSNAVNWKRFENATWPRPEPGRLLFIARMVPTKGLVDVIRAVRIVLDRDFTVTLDCVGDGPSRAEAESLSRELGLSEVVRFTGLVPEAETVRYYLEAGMLVFPTHREGFSMTVFQALAAGLPILTTRCYASADHLKEPDHCLWVEPRDPQGLAERIMWLLDHPEAAAHMSRESMKLARTFDAAPVARPYIDAYRRIARSTRSVAALRSNASPGEPRPRSG
jgi:glycosyltransferase involved in cell wall biosynthesis